MGRVRILSAVLIFSVVAQVAFAQSRGLGVVNGEVRGNAGERIDGGTVKFMLGSGDAIQATTDRDGKWRAAGIGKGQWRVLVSASGYAARIVTLAIDKESFGTDPVITVLRRLSKD